MALQLSGQISLSNITSEMGILNSNVSLSDLSTHSTLNDQSPQKPNESQPHAMSEFFAYDHSYSSLKPLMGGAENPTFSGKWFDFCNEDTKSFYYHDGNKDLPMTGDNIYRNDRGAYYLVGNSHIAIAHPESMETYVVTTDLGEVIDINSCEGIGGDPKDPGLEGPGEDDPFRR